MAWPDIFPLRRITESRRYHWWAYGVVAIGMSILSIEGYGSSAALSAISSDFYADRTSVSLISLGYSLSLSAMLMPMGRIADMIGRKRLYLIGFLVFVASALVGGVSQSLGVLILMRIVQGAVSAGAYASGMVLLLEAFPDNQRGKAIGFYMAAKGAGAILGPM